jgi:hypothetical protein
MMRTGNHELLEQALKDLNGGSLRKKRDKDGQWAMGERRWAIGKRTGRRHTATKITEVTENTEMKTISCKLTKEQSILSLPFVGLLRLPSVISVPSVAKGSLSCKPVGLYAF